MLAGLAVSLSLVALALYVVITEALNSGWRTLVRPSVHTGLTRLALQFVLDGLWWIGTALTLYGLTVTFDLASADWLDASIRSLAWFLGTTGVMLTVFAVLSPRQAAEPLYRETTPALVVLFVAAAGVLVAYSASLVFLWRMSDHLLNGLCLCALAVAATRLIKATTIWERLRGRTEPRRGGQPATGG